MASIPPPTVSLSEHLAKNAGVPAALRHLLLDVATATKHISYALQTTETGLAGTTNTFGEEQLALDVMSDMIVAQHLREGGNARAYASEESGDLVELTTDAPYTVVFDPLDGSSLVDVDFAIGTIVGVYETHELVGMTPRQQCAALYVLYGPRTVLVYSTGNGVHEFLLNDVGEYVLLREHLGVGDTAKTYAPGNLQAIHENAGYKSVLDHWLNGPYKLRYSGCMVADIHHILAKGTGVFVNAGGGKYPQGKLRLLYECGPFAYLLEQAGGAASNGETNVLDVRITELNQCCQIIAGSANEVTAVAQLLSA